MVLAERLRAHNLLKVYEICITSQLIEFVVSLIQSLFLCAYMLYEDRIINLLLIITKQYDDDAYCRSYLYYCRSY